MLGRKKYQEIKANLTQQRILFVRRSRGLHEGTWTIEFIFSEDDDVIRRPLAAAAEAQPQARLACLPLNKGSCVRLRRIAANYWHLLWVTDCHWTPSSALTADYKRSCNSDRALTCTDDDSIQRQERHLLLLGSFLVALQSPSCRKLIPRNGRMHVYQPLIATRQHSCLLRPFRPYCVRRHCVDLDTVRIHACCLRELDVRPSGRVGERYRVSRVCLELFAASHHRTRPSRSHHN